MLRYVEGSAEQVLFRWLLDARVGSAISKLVLLFNLLYFPLKVHGRVANIESTEETRDWQNLSSKTSGTFTQS